MTLFEIAALLKVACQKDVLLTGVSIDSRTVQSGNIFVAIRGERFDGHDFIPEAVANGAQAVVCNKPVDMAVEQFVVDDTVNALAIIAKFHRQQCACSVIALTGSNGKTSVKEMIASILPKPSHATPGNLNNHLGVPLSVLQLKPEHCYAVFELGANHVGEIAHTVKIVEPDVTLINNIAPAHIEGFGSIDGVARAKGEIHNGLNATGTVVINDDDGYAHFWDSAIVDRKTLRFSRTKPADVYARDITVNTKECAQFTLVTPLGETELQLNVPGLHNVSNALAAASCTIAIGISLEDVKTGLESFTGVPGRLTHLAGKNNSLIIDDTYNANLSSVLSALEVLGKQKGRRVFVFGDMGELGECSKQHHEEIGLAAKKHGIDVLLTCGEQSAFTAKAFGIEAKNFTNQGDLLNDLLPHMQADTTVLIKGSRSAGMDKIVKQLICL